jgi:hypothetical protein
MDFELIRVPGFGRYRKATVGIGRLEIIRLSDFQIIKSGSGEIEVSGFEWEDRTVDHGNCEWRISDFELGNRKVEHGNCEWRVSNFECESRAVDVGNRRWMSLDVGENFFVGRLLVPDGLAPRSVVVACSRLKSLLVGRKKLFGRSFQFSEKKKRCCKFKKGLILK